MERVIGRRITCKKCGFKGFVEAHDTVWQPKNTLFTVIRKDEQGYIYMLCPSCYADEKYSPYVFINPTLKIGCLGIVIIIVYLFAKYILL